MTTLKYRLPHQKVVEINGSFQKVNDISAFEGMVISNFEGTEFYGFFEGLSEENALSILRPIVVSKEMYLFQLEHFIESLKTEQVEKAILSRVKQVQNDKENLDLLFDKLESNYPNAFCYYFDSPQFGTWIGATPESLIQIEGHEAKTIALAGTKRVSDSSDWGKKELYEQEIVKISILDSIQHFDPLVQVSELSELVAGPVKHLVNHFSFVFDQSRTLELLQILHPTPAISGFPKDKALSIIHALEGHQRRFYAGIIGFKSIQKTALFVNLRCAEQIGNELFLYLGGGITKDSIPESEWQETENKAKTITDLLV